MTTIVWCGEHGDYEIPEQFHSLKFTKSGWFDRRRGEAYYADFKKWLEFEEKAIEIAPGFFAIYPE